MNPFKSFFYRGDDFQPPYFWITLFCLLAVSLFMCRLFNIGEISDTLILGVLGFIVTWIGLYNWNNKNLSP